MRNVCRRHMFLEIVCRLLHTRPGMRVEVLRGGVILVLLAELTGRLPVGKSQIRSFDEILHQYSSKIICLSSKSSAVKNAARGARLRLIVLRTAG